MSTIIGHMNTPYGQAKISTSTYPTNGSTAVCLDDRNTGELIAVLSTCLPDHKDMLGANEFFAKTWSENEQLAALALQSGIFEDTGRRVHTGWVEAQIWRIKEA